MTLKVNWLSGFWENCLNILMGFQYERPWLKVTFFIVIVSLGLTLQARIMTLASIVLKINFSKCFPFKYIKKQIRPWRYVSWGQPRIVIWTNLVGPTSMSQSYQPSGSWTEDFQGVLPHMGVAANLVKKKTFKKLLFLHPKESPYEMWVLLTQWFLRKLCFNVLISSNLSDLGWKVKGQPWPLELICSHCRIMLNILRENYVVGFNNFQK